MFLICEFENVTNWETWVIFRLGFLQGNSMWRHHFQILGGGEETFCSDVHDKCS